MANNLATLEASLETKLRDTTNAVWADAELNNYLNWACARMYPNVSLPVQEEVTLVDAQDSYTLTDVSDISRVDLINAASPNELVMHLMGGTWEFWRTPETLGGTLFINTDYADASYHLRVHGYAPYDLATNLPPDKYVQTILAMAAAEAVRVMMVDRAKYKQWDVISQNQNISVNEFIQMVNEGDNEARMLAREQRVWRKPKPATRG